MKVAFLLKGAISKTTGKSSFPDDVYRDGPYVDFASCADSIKQHIVDANPACEFDFFLHTWHPDLSDDLIDLYHPINHSFELNSVYKNTILSVLNAVRQPERFYGQVAMCISFKRVTELLQSYVEETHTEYGLVIFYRYDVLLWKDMKLSEYSPDNLYVNGDAMGHRIGDFHFVMSYDNALEFGLGLYDSISMKNLPKDHKVIKRYVQSYMHKQLTMDDIIAGKHQEVMRKLPSTGK